MKKLLAPLSMGLCLLMTAFHAVSAPCEDPRPLRLALVPIKNPTLQLTQYRPLIRQLERKLDRNVQAIPATSYGTVIEGLLAGDIDLAELGPASYAIALGRGAQITPIASFQLRKGQTTSTPSAYHSLLITRRDSGLNTIDQLRGHTLSLIDPASTSGAVLPRHAMNELTGSPIETYFARITFAGSHARAIDIVQQKLVDAAFVSSTSVDDAIRRGKLRFEDIQILWKSQLIPYDPFAHRKQLCPALVASIREVFLGDVSPLQGMFQELGMTGFAAVSDEHYREIRQLYPAK